MSRTFFKNASFHKNKATKRYEFDIEDMDLSIVNAIRRVVLSEIPNLGFLGEGDVSIQILKNSGPLHNEFMIHRIGLIPLHFTEEEVESFAEGDYEFSCDVRNNDPSLMNVTTRHITGTRQGTPLTDVELRRIFPANPITEQHVLITRLRQGEELAFHAKVVKSKAKAHASFAPSSLCTFFYHLDETKVKEAKNILDKERAYIKNQYGDPTRIRFMIEPEGGLSARYMVAKALEILLDKIDTVHRELDVLDSEKVKVSPTLDIPNSFDLHIFQEDDTLGNLFQSLLYNLYIRENNKVLDNKYKVGYVGYFAPHPLEPKIVLRMSLLHDDITPDVKDFVHVMKESCRHVEREVREAYDAWTRFEE